MTTTFECVRSIMLAVPLALAAGIASAGGLAVAVETIEPTPMASAPILRSSNWSGFYAGGQLGYGKVTSPFLDQFGDALGDELADLDIFLEDFAIDRDFTGAVYGVHAGYMYNLGSIVLGTEVDYELTSMKQSFSGTVIPFESDDTIAFDGAFEIDSILRVKARIGYDAGALLPYITGGVVRAVLDLNVSEGSESQKIDGDFYGAGVAYKFSDNILIGGEVLQHKFYETDGGSISGAGIRATTATARVSYQF